MKRFLSLILLCASAYAAAPTTAIWHASQSATAANAGGGGFDLGNASFMTDLACTTATGNSPACTSATYTFLTGGAGTGDVGAWLFVQSGTNWDAYRACPIASVSAGAATLTATAGSCVDFSSINGKPTVSTTAGIATVASPTGGVYGIMYNMRDAPHFTYTDLTVGATTTQVTSAAHPFGRNFVGNAIHIISGTGCTFTTMTGVLFVSSVSGVTATLNSSAGTAASTCTGNGPGAWSLGSSTTNQTDTQALGLMTASATNANRLLVKYSATAYSSQAANVGGTSGNAANPISIEGYNTVPGDRPTGSTAPTWDAAANILTVGANWIIRNINMQGSGTSVVTTGNGFYMEGVRLINYSTTAGRAALNNGSTNITILGSEFVSYRGNAISLSAGTGIIKGNYIHDSNNGISYVGTTAIIGNIISDNVAAAITGTFTLADIIGNTIYGTVNKLGTALIAATGSTTIRFINNIVYGFVTPVSQTDAGVGAYTSSYNDWYNNTNASTNWVNGSTDLAVDPQFTNVTQITNASSGFGVGTCGASDNTLTVSGASPGFASAGVTAGRDYVYLTAGTNTTTTKYGIVTVAATTLVLDSDCSSSTTASNISWQITLARDFSVGTNVKNAGWPGVFPQSAATGYSPIGAVTSQAGAGGGQKAYGESR